MDKGVTGAGTFDFYMVPHHALLPSTFLPSSTRGRPAALAVPQVPHHALQGTARPSHYHVLANDARLSPDEIQSFTFQLCHMCAPARCLASACICQATPVS